MNLAFLLSLQAAAAPAPAASRIAVSDFDLARHKPSAAPADLHSLFACDRSSGSDIVVCARRAGPAYPLDEMARIFEARPLRAETGLGGGAVAGVHVQQVDFGSDSPSAHSGLKSNRITIGIKQSF